jgi:hypothetical protein
MYGAKSSLRCAQCVQWCEQGPRPPTRTQHLECSGLRYQAADGRWARVGSSNLNVASWIGNYELDAARK